MRRFSGSDISYEDSVPGEFQKLLAFDSLYHYSGFRESSPEYIGVYTEEHPGKTIDNDTYEINEKTVKRCETN